MSRFRDAVFIARKDVRYLLREKETIAWVFVMPFVFMYFIGTVTGGFAGGGNSGPDRIAVSGGLEGGLLEERLAKRLQDNEFVIERPETEEERSRYQRRLEIPEGFTDAVIRGEEVELKFVRKDSGLGQDFDDIRIGRAVYTVLADVAVAAAETGAPSAEAFARLDATPRALTLEVAPAGERAVIPTGFEQTIPGILVMFTLLVMLTSGSILLVVERNQGLLRRLAYTPITRRSVVFGKWLGKMALALVQIGVAILIGTFAFGMEWGPDLPMILLVLLGWASFCASLGLLIGGAARTESQAAGLGVLATMILAALGGCWWPIEITPEWMQSMQKLLPTGWAMDAMHQLVSFQNGPASAVPHLVTLVLGSLVVGWAGVRTFRYQ